METMKSGGKQLRLQLQQEAIVICSQSDASTRDGRSSVPGNAEIRCLDGRHVNRLDDDTFEIVETGQIVRRKH